MVYPLTLLLTVHIAQLKDRMQLTMLSLKQGSKKAPDAGAMVSACSVLAQSISWTSTGPEVVRINPEVVRISQTCQEEREGHKEQRAWSSASDSKTRHCFRGERGTWHCMVVCCSSRVRTGVCAHQNHAIIHCTANWILR